MIDLPNYSLASAHHASRFRSETIPLCQLTFESNKYVRCLQVDFSKAFDVVAHLALVEKLKTRNIANNIIDWVISFLTDMNRYKKMEDNRSFTRVINRSIVQGSGIGPILFIIFIGNLRPVGLANSLTKYVDDASLLVPKKK